MKPARTSRVTSEDVTYTATAIFGDGTAADVTLAAAWLSSVPGVASIDVAGLATPRQPA